MAPEARRGDFSPDQIILIVVLVFINAGAFAAAALAWNYAAKRAYTVDELLRTSSWKDAAVDPLFWGLSTRRQLALPAIFAAIPIVAAITEAMSKEGIPLSLFAIRGMESYTLAIVGSDVWWLLIPPIVILRLRSASDLNLRWHDPARTPGIRTFAEGYGFSSIFVALAAAAVTIPGLLHHQIFGSATIWLYAALMLVSLWIGVATQLQIYLIVRRARLHWMDAFEVARPSLRPSVWRRPDSGITGHAADSLSVYASIAASSNLPYGSAIIVQYFTAVLGSVVGLLLQHGG
jgi:hypothetical protein